MQNAVVIRNPRQSACCPQVDLRTTLRHRSGRDHERLKFGDNGGNFPLPDVEERVAREILCWVGGNRPADLAVILRFF